MPTIFTPLRGILLAGLLAGGWCSSAAVADDWMFRRSYYSHALPAGPPPGYPLPCSRSASRRAIAGTTPGFAARGGHRHSYIVLGSGATLDVTVLHEDWMERRP